MWQLIVVSAPVLGHVALEIIAVIIIAAVGTLAAVEVGVRLGAAREWLSWAVDHERRMRMLRGQRVAPDGSQRGRAPDADGTP